MKTMKRFSLALLLAAAASSAFAQQPPAAARGFDPDKVFAAGPIDSINAFNGNVIATIPLGETYTVSPTLAYSFKAIHNGKTWDYVRRHITVPVPCDPPSQSECTTVWTDMQAVPDGTANAGFGWRVQFARFILPGDLQANTDRTLLETPDGAQHGMYGSLHDGDSQDGASYTRDATYLRWRETGVAGHTAVDTAEGVTYEFRNYKLTQMHDQVKDASGNYINRVDIQYGSAAGDPAWPCAYPTISQKITDTRNRTSYVCFANMNYDGTNRPTVTDVYVGTAAGTGHYELNHVQTAFARENYDKGYQHLYLPPAATVPALMSITLADDSSYGFQYFGTTAHPGIATGNFESITLPTRGSYKYHYGYYQIPMSYGCPTYEEWLASYNPGVAKREERGANGTVVGRTTYGTNGPSGGVDGGYYQCTTEQEGEGYFTAFAPGAELSNFVIPGDNHSKTIHYYSVWPGYNRMMIDSPDGFKRVEYGLPFTRNASKMRNGLYLSTQTYLCTDAANAQCSPTPIRSTYVQYEVDAYVNHLDISTLDHNSRLKKMETVYFDDIDPNTDQPATTTSTVSNDDFDGLGHYRVSETAGFGAATKRRTTTNFNSNAGTFPGTHTLPSTASPWLLNLFTYQETKEIDPSGAVLSSAKTEVCFDSNNGFLERRRTIGGGTIAPAKDLLAVFASNGNGEVASESYYGGDGVPLPPGFNTCSTSISGPQFHVTHDYAAGVMTRSQYDGTTFNSYDVDVYPSTSAINTSRDTVGIPTTYVYDALGRVTEVHPQGAGWTEYEYNIPTTSSGVPSLVVRQRPEGASQLTAAIAEQRYYFDGLGRLIQRKIAMPNNQWATVNRTYDFMGRIAREYVPNDSTSPDFDVSFTPSTYTGYTYDDLGRNTVVKSPDGKETNTAYFAASQQRRTSSVATGVNEETPQTARYIYDYLGRLRTVKEKNNTITAGYSYDIGDRLSFVQITGPEGIQTRTFGYDGRGFLTSESHPEGGTTSYTYDAKGNALTKQQGTGGSLFDLTYFYDAAGRPLTVSGRNPHFDSQAPDQPAFRVMRSFAYGASNAPGDLRKGKLVSAARYNYDPVQNEGTTYKVAETYVYGDAAGRRTSRRTTITKGFGAPESEWNLYKTIEMAVVHDELGLPKEITYPMCWDCGASRTGPWRDQRTTYDRGRVKAVGGFLSDMTYWPNGMWKTMARSNGMTDQQTVDPLGMARPAEIFSQFSTACSAPKITAQPEGDSITPANPSVTLEVSASGTALTYSWRTTTSSTVIGSARTLVVSPTSTTQYVVTVSNSRGSVQSVAATVSVGECIPPGGTISVTELPDGGRRLTVIGTGSEPRTHAWRQPPSTTVIGEEASLTVASFTGTVMYTVTITNGCGTVVKEFTVSQWQAAYGLTATRLTDTSISVTWMGYASSYELQRRSDASGWARVVDVTGTSYTNMGLQPGKTYAYRVVGDGGTSNADVATTGVFAQANVGGVITAASFDAALAAVNSVRAAFGWGALTWSTAISTSDPVPATGAWIRTIHLAACRARMNEALGSLGIVPAPWPVDPDPAGATIKASHINDITVRAY